MASFSRGTPLSLGNWREIDGRDVVVKDQAQWTAPTSAVLPGLTTQLGLRNLLRDVETIRIATEIGVSLPTKLERIHFDDLTALPVTRGSESQITLEKMQVREPAPTNQPGHTDMGSCDIELTLTVGPETRVDFIFLTEQRVSYPVEVVVGLPSFAAQPVQLTELQYDGSSPLEIEVLKINTEQVFRVVEVNVKNNSNKGILRADATMQYHDRAGTVLREQTAMLTANSEPGDSRFTLVPAKTTRPAMATAFFATDALSSVTFVLERVRFVDGTEWIPPAGN
jgi:hypothetical protein